MLWIVLCGVLMIGLVWFVGARTQQQNSARGLGKGASHAGSTRYKNRSSRQREKKRAKESAEPRSRAPE